MHESGHGLYEQGLPRNYRFLSSWNSYLIGSSQSRRADFGKTKLVEQPLSGTLPCLGLESSSRIAQWSNETLDLVANEVKPDFIRVEADEVTYNLHIMIRYEIEKMIFNDGLKVKIFLRPGTK